MWSIATADGLRVSVAWIAPSETAGADRRALAQGLQQAITRRLAWPGEPV
jgi:hypothetical protein